MYVLRPDFHCVKYAKIRAYSDPYIPVCDYNYIDCLYAGKCGYDSAYIRKNTDQRNLAFRHILSSG